MSIERFIKAQNKYFDMAKHELKNGKKQSHWMWFIFPQIKGLGYSEMSVYYAVNNKTEINEYINNKYLMDNYLELCCILLSLETNNPKVIFGDIDSMKLQSSLTLFYVFTNNLIIEKLLNKFYHGYKDNYTYEMIQELNE